MEDSQLITLITNSISNFGFPIVITVYLLYRFEKRIDALNSSIIELLQAIKEEVRK
ncbi:YvrJ family protein [Paenibacillus donghaensis]|uniref:YvrJ family protein n=1 Tax=Paenibacillus donghaensis TaxID=414771 RepID=UPI001884686F|nr:YvrJ family protein [Paenibacillus donghaensis]MBE9916354.1 YvrJ family protein [Paenibacillus donghaensis]